LESFSYGKGRNFTKENDFQKPWMKGRICNLVLPFTKKFYDKFGRVILDVIYVPSNFCICSLGQKTYNFTFLDKKPHCLIGIYHSCMKGRRPSYSDATSLDKFKHVYTGCLQRSHIFFLYLCNFQDFIRYFHSNCTCFFDCTTFFSYVLGSLQLFQGWWNRWGLGAVTILYIPPSLYFMIGDFCCFIMTSRKN